MKQPTDELDLTCLPPKFSSEALANYIFEDTWFTTAMRIDDVDFQRPHRAVHNSAHLAREYGCDVE